MRANEKKGMEAGTVAHTCVLSTLWQKAGVAISVCTWVSYHWHWTMDQRKIGGGELSCAVRARFSVWNCPIGWKSWVVKCAFWQQTRLPYKNSPLDVTKSSAVPAMHLYCSIGDRAWSICLRWCWCLPSRSDEMKWRQVGIFNSPGVCTG